LTGVKSRRYLDIYIEQASQLINQIHQNIQPVQRSILPRLYILMVEIGEIDKVSNSQLINFTDLLLYSRNQDDIIIRWSDDTFAIIGYEKANNISDLANRLSNRSSSVFKEDITMTMAYSFYPFNREQPVDITWDQISVMIELGLQLARTDGSISWVGLCAPKVQPFNYVNVMQHNSLTELKETIEIKQG
jgi:GGDEF domain-containing protein